PELLAGGTAAARGRRVLHPAQLQGGPDLLGHHGRLREAPPARRLHPGVLHRGGRSRTGKLLPPKFGMLTLEVDAWLTGVKPDAYFAPISLSYEKIVEHRSYQHELLGGEKQKEDAKALLSATK